jgi:hypothetical protein
LIFQNPHPFHKDSQQRIVLILFSQYHLHTNNASFKSQTNSFFLQPKNYFSHLYSFSFLKTKHPEKKNDIR